MGCCLRLGCMFVGICRVFGSLRIRDIASASRMIRSLWFCGANSRSPFMEEESPSEIEGGIRLVSVLFIKALSNK